MDAPAESSTIATTRAHLGAGLTRPAETRMRGAGGNIAPQNFAQDAEEWHMDSAGDPIRRRHERVQLGGTALLIVDPRRGLLGAKGQLIDLSEGGCQLRLQRPVDAHLAGRVRVAFAGNALWLPVTTASVRGDADGWTVRCVFTRLRAEKRNTLRELLFELSLTRGPLSPDRPMD
jgi:PilZ domain